MKPKPRNLAASFRARLLALAKERREDFQFVLSRWLAERFLYRLGISPYKDQFALKGAMLFIAWSGKLHRPTRDVDLLRWGSSEVADVVNAVRDICRVPAEDGLEFDLQAIEGERIREDGNYEGVRVKVAAVLDAARLQLQVDVGFGDAVEPAPEERKFPVLLPVEAPTVRAYPPEALIAEKLEAMVVLGIANSRMKDFYDIWTLARSFPFRLPTLARSLRATFERRGTPLPDGLPFALTSEFLDDPVKKTQWQAFRKRLGEHTGNLSLQPVGGMIAEFLRPAIDAARGGKAGAGIWTPPGPWRAPAEDRPVGPA